MTLPPAAAQRQFQPRRQIDIQVAERRHGLWRVDALLTAARLCCLPTVNAGIRTVVTSLRQIPSQVMHRALQQFAGGARSAAATTVTASVPA